MKDCCIIMFHQGWTDIILCIGIVFYNLKYYNKIILLMREDAKDMINFIFRFNNNIKIIYINKNNLDNPNIRKYYIDNIIKINNNKISNDDILLYGEISKCHYGKHSNYKSIKCNPGDKYYFYNTYNIDSIESIKSFNIIRDYDLENNKYEEIIRKYGKKYVIVFNDYKRNLCINPDYIINKNLPTVNLCKSSTICFDMLRVLHESSEIHILSTFWSLIIYQLQKKYNLFKDIPIFFHSRIRNNYCDFLYENHNWIIC